MGASSADDRGVPTKAKDTAKANFFLSNDEGIKDPIHVMNSNNTQESKIINTQH